MNNSFLEYVAKDIINKYGTDLSRIAVVFPNKRASLFLNEHLARMVDAPIWSPSYLTISELFRSHSDLIVAEPIKLICDLHKVFTNITQTDETLDHFYGWGQLLLSDFDDIDKNMADAKKIFCNLRDIHELDDLSYLSEEQKSILKRFFSNFTDNHNTELKDRFIKLWSHFYDIYKEYNDYLSAQQLAYEGALYRQVVENEDIDFKYDTYLFIGFNMLQTVEQKLFKRLMNNNKAKFYWDFDQYFIANENNEAGYFIRKYLAEFPNEIDNNSEIYNYLRKDKNITYISAPTENIQARYVSRWLQSDNRIKDGRKTAIVLCDENLLHTVIHCIPPEVSKLNITTGYPLSLTPVSSLINILLSLQTAGLAKYKDRYNMHYVNKVLNHPYMRLISSSHALLKKQFQEHKTYYPSREFLAQDEGLSLLFSDLSSSSSTLFNARLCQWILDILKLIGNNGKDSEDQLFQESLFRAFTLMNQLYDLIEKGDLEIDTITLIHFINQLISNTSIPFHGEPAVGIQVMGVLETRNLDFDHLLILSCNEGNMPKGVNDSSFIPYVIRKAYHLTTIDHKLAIYSYYFHSMIQRAKDITILYNNSTEDGHVGEMSRFMLQLMVESNHLINKSVLQAGQLTVSRENKTIEKDVDIMAKLNAIAQLSPTAINRYIRCQLQFYYNNVAGIKEPEDNNEDEIDNRVFGNIFHKVAEIIYNRLMKGNNIVNQEDIIALLKNEKVIEQAVDKAFAEELFMSDGVDKTFDYNGVQLINRAVIISYIRQLLKIDAKHSPFSILGLEQKVQKQMVIKTNTGHKDIMIGGYIDRLDMVKDEDGRNRIRIIDYKTGKLPSMKVNSIPELFTNENMRKKHTDYFLQTIFYSLIVCHSREWNKENAQVSPALMFIQYAGADEFNPIISINNEPVYDVSKYDEEFTHHLESVLSEIFDSSIPFSPTKDKETCKNCPYRQLCIN